MSRKKLPAHDHFIGLSLSSGTKIRGLLPGGDAGRNGLVFEGVRDVAGHPMAVAVKVVPGANLRAGWDNEITKPLLLPQTIHVIRPQAQQTYTFPGEKEHYVIIEMPLINGDSLRDYLTRNTAMLTHVFCLRLAQALLEFLNAMKVVGIHHGDVHAGNIIVEKSTDAYIQAVETFWLGDFGVGGSRNDLEPKDDYSECARIVEKAVEAARPNATDGQGRYVLDQLSSYLCARLRDTNPASNDYQNPRAWWEQLGLLLQSPPGPALDGQDLSTPFDYMSCEQIGEQYKLLQRLFSLNFPNCPDFLELQNTVLTGPRGCGKTMILRSMGTKAQVLGGSNGIAASVGLYYHCNDLWFAFPSPKRIPEEEFLDLSVHYFNLSILYELLGTLQVMTSSAGAGGTGGTLDVSRFISWLGAKVGALESPARGNEQLADVRARVGVLRQRIKKAIARRVYRLDDPTGLEFLEEMVHALHSEIPALERMPVLVFLDDYSTPRVDERLQASINRVVFQRSAQLFFKIATESITTLHPRDSSNKLLEVEREYSVIDLGTSFMTASLEDKQKFVEEVINTRFGASKTYDMPPIAELIGDDGESNTDIARKIRSGDVAYSGLRVLVQMCSGDITHTLRLVRDMIASSGGLERFRAPLAPQVRCSLPINKEIQNKAINKLGADFLATIKGAPQHGERICEVVEAFGEVANWELKHLDSPNEKITPPPKQSFRIEMREALRFGEDESDIEELYSTLLRYGVFVRDATGKSLRSHVVPRLYLRRLLIPLFRLTFSKRDNVGMEIAEFKTLLRSPRAFVDARKRKKGSADQRGQQRFQFEPPPKGGGA